MNQTPFLKAFSEIDGAWMTCKLNPEFMKTKEKKQTKYFGLRCNFTKEQCERVRKGETVEYVSKKKGYKIIPCIMANTYSVY